MPRIILSLILISISFPAFAAEPCANRIQAYTVYEELVEGKIVEKHALHVVGELSPHSSLEGLAISRSEDSKTQIEISINQPTVNKKTQSRSWPVKPWARDGDYFATENLQIADVVNNYANGTFMLRLKVNGRVLCEDRAKNIVHGE